MTTTATKPSHRVEPYGNGKLVIRDVELFAGYDPEIDDATEQADDMKEWTKERCDEVVARTKVYMTRGALPKLAKRHNREGEDTPQESLGDIITMRCEDRNGVPLILGDIVVSQETFDRDLLSGHFPRRSAEIWPDAYLSEVALLGRETSARPLPDMRFDRNAAGEKPRHFVRGGMPSVFAFDESKINRNKGRFAPKGQGDSGAGPDDAAGEKSGLSDEDKETDRLIEAEESDHFRDLKTAVDAGELSPEEAAEELAAEFHLSIDDAALMFESGPADAPGFTPSGLGPAGPADDPQNDRAAMKARAGEAEESDEARDLGKMLAEGSVSLEDAADDLAAEYMISGDDAMDILERHADAWVDTLAAPDPTAAPADVDFPMADEGESGAGASDTEGTMDAGLEDALQSPEAEDALMSALEDVPAGSFTESDARELAEQAASSVASSLGLGGDAVTAMAEQFYYDITDQFPTDDEGSDDEGSDDVDPYEEKRARARAEAWEMNNRQAVVDLHERVQAGEIDEATAVDMLSALGMSLDKAATMWDEITADLEYESPAGGTFDGPAISPEPMTGVDPTPIPDSAMETGRIAQMTDEEFEAHNAGAPAAPMSKDAEAAIRDAYGSMENLVADSEKSGIPLDEIIGDIAGDYWLNDDDKDAMLAAATGGAPEGPTSDITEERGFDSRDVKPGPVQGPPVGENDLDQREDTIAAITESDEYREAIAYATDDRTAKMNDEQRWRLAMDIADDLGAEFRLKSSEMQALADEINRSLKRDFSRRGRKRSFAAINPGAGNTFTPAFGDDDMDPTDDDRDLMSRIEEMEETFGRDKMKRCLNGRYERDEDEQDEFSMDDAEKDEASPFARRAAFRRRMAFKRRLAEKRAARRAGAAKKTGGRDSLALRSLNSRLAAMESRNAALRSELDRERFSRELDAMEAEGYGFNGQRDSVLDDVAGSKNPEGRLVFYRSVLPQSPVGGRISVSNVVTKSGPSAALAPDKLEFARSKARAKAIASRETDSPITYSDAFDEVVASMTKEG